MQMFNCGMSARVTEHVWMSGPDLTAPEGPKPGYCPTCGQYPQTPTAQPAAQDQSTGSAEGAIPPQTGDARGNDRPEQLTGITTGLPDPAASPDDDLLRLLDNWQRYDDADIGAQAAARIRALRLAANLQHSKADAAPAVAQPEEKP